MASSFYITATLDGVGWLLGMDATKKAVVRETGELSRHPVVSGATISDNYKANNPTFSLEGFISDIKSGYSPLRGAQGDTVTSVSGEMLPATTDKYLEVLRKLKEREVPLTLTMGKIGTFYPVMITTLEILQDSRNGIADGVCSYQVSLGIEKFRFASVTELVEVRDPITNAVVRELENTTGASEKVDLGPIFVAPGIRPWLSGR